MSDPNSTSSDILSDCPVNDILRPGSEKSHLRSTKVLSFLRVPGFPSTGNVGRDKSKTIFSIVAVSRDQLDTWQQ